MRKFKVEKLIRDGYVDHPGKSRPHYRILNPIELISCLKNKLIEEVNELVSAQTTEQIKAELADVYEVLEALQRQLGLSLESVKHIQKEKHDQLGGFSKGYYVHSITMQENDPNLSKFLNEPQKYPER